MAARLTSVLLWILAFVLAVALGAFQRMTGPTYPKHGSAVVAGHELQYSMPRTHGGDGGLRVRLAGVGEVVRGELSWRRFPTDEPWQSLPMARNDEGELEAVIPHQPPAGKVEYQVVLNDGSTTVHLPAGEPVVARFRAEVPAGVLIPHILAMFAAMMLATRSLLEEFRPHRPRPRRLVLATMVLLVVGGLFLGPAVQKYAFDAWWTGWPNGTDLTDNKTALATLAWLPATLLALRNRPLRAAVIVGWLVMMGVFLVPHSFRGSQIDWSSHSGTPPAAGQSL
ncbi:MAG: hypothetical protein C3F15_04215 [Holophagae bacterium]|nr:MAG: hypothetical protein C3F15_04215 [Holophagae bacterium]